VFGLHSKLHVQQRLGETKPARPPQQDQTNETAPEGVNDGQSVAKVPACQSPRQVPLPFWGLWRTEHA